MSDSAASEPIPNQIEIESASFTATAAYIRRFHPVATTLSSLSIALSAALAAYVVYLYFHQSDSLVTFIWLTLAPLSIPVVISWYYHARLQHEMMQQIAISLGYAFSERGTLNELNNFLLFSIGHSRRVKDVMTGTYRTLPLRIFSYQYTVGSGKSSHTYYKTVLQLSCGSPLSHFVLHPRTFFDSDSSFSSLFSGLQEADLEGDFGKYFSLRIEPSAQIEIREIFEPDVMQSLIHGFSSLSIEARGETLAITHDGVLSDRARFLALVALADKLIDTLLPGLASAAEDKSATAA